MLTPLGPNDGRDSIQLPITVEPHVDLQDRQVVTATGGGFVPGEQVGIVQCAREAGGEVRERRAGIDGCDIGSVQYADADADGVATGDFTVSGCSPPPRPARSTARSKPSAASSPWVPSTTTTAPEDSA